MGINRIATINFFISKPFSGHLNHLLISVYSATHKQLSNYSVCCTLAEKVSVQHLQLSTLYNGIAGWQG